MNEENPIPDSEWKRYERHFLLPGFSQEHQRRIRLSSVIIIGVGGLGNIVAPCLAAVGVGKLTLVDYDSIDVSNLSRQHLFSEADVGKKKSEVAAEKLASHYPDAQIKSIVEVFSDANGEQLCAGHHLIIDCCDVRDVKYSIDNVASNLRIPLVFGAVSRFDGQVSVFHGHSATSYAQVFPIGKDSSIHGCDTLGVWAPAVGIIGNIMAQEALNMLAFGQSRLDGKLMQFDLKNYHPVLIDVAVSKETKPLKFPGLSQAIQPIRESEVYDIQAIEPGVISILIIEDGESGAIHFDFCLTVNDIIWQSADWDKDRAIILQCIAGKRSLEVSLLLSEQGFRKLYPVFPNE